MTTILHNAPILKTAAPGDLSKTAERAKINRTLDEAAGFVSVKNPEADILITDQGMRKNSIMRPPAHEGLQQAAETTTITSANGADETIAQTSSQILGQDWSGVFSQTKPDPQAILALLR